MGFKSRNPAYISASAKKRRKLILSLRQENARLRKALVDLKHGVIPEDSLWLINQIVKGESSE